MTPTRKQCLGAAIKADWWGVLIILALFTGLTYIGCASFDQQQQRIAQVAE